MAKYSEFGLKVKIEMLKQDVETKEILNLLGISQQYLLEILRGTRPGKKQKPVIAEYLGIEEN
jgi:transcriptional regulator with XRE-family HTH domain